MGKGLNRALWQGVARSGLLGFCDPAPDEAKALRVRYLWRRSPYAATIADKVPPTCEASIQQRLQMLV